MLNLKRKKKAALQTTQPMISITPISSKKPTLQIPVIAGAQSADATKASAGAASDQTSKVATSKGTEASASSRKANQSRMVAQIQSDAILKSSATALSVSTSDILQVQVSPAGSVMVQGSIDRDLAAKLEAALQGNTEFVRAYKNATAVVDTAGALVDEGIEEYA